MKGLKEEFENDEFDFKHLLEEQNQKFTKFIKISLSDFQM